MDKIKLFMYIDYEQVTSLYAQLNGGVVESFSNRQQKTSVDSEKQKGPVFSGKFLGDSEENTTEKIEKKLLHDYIYNSFENQMLQANKVLKINNDTIIENIEPLKLIKVQGQATIFDSNAILNLLDNFNDLGEAFGYLNFFEDTRFKSLNKSEQKKHLADFLKKENLYFEDVFLKNIRRLILQSHKNSFKIEIELNKIRYTAFLDRGKLKESEQLLIDKLARNTEVKVTLFGVTTQTLNSKNNTPVDSSEEFKEVTRSLIHSISEVEDVFGGKSKSEIIIDPLAVYLELEL